MPFGRKSVRISRGYSNFLLHIPRSRCNSTTPDHRRLSPCPEDVPPEEAAREMDARRGQHTAAVRYLPFHDNTAKLIAPWYPRAVAELGQQWEKVSEIVGRMSSDCRDRYRNHIANREVRITGPWSKGEEEELTKIVTEMTVNQGKDIDNDVFWGIISEKMGNRRGRQQCRIKWWLPFHLIVQCTDVAL